MRVGGDDGELRPSHCIYVYSIESNPNNTPAAAAAAAVWGIRRGVFDIPAIRAGPTPIPNLITSNPLNPKPQTPNLKLPNPSTPNPKP